VFVPCALGGVISDETLLEIQARAVCGLANNQLAEPRLGTELARRGIAYVPDYVVNAGGMISCPSSKRRKRAVDRVLMLPMRARNNALPVAGRP